MPVSSSWPYSVGVSPASVLMSSPEPYRDKIWPLLRGTTAERLYQQTSRHRPCLSKFSTNVGYIGGRGEKTVSFGWNNCCNVDLIESEAGLQFRLFNFWKSLLEVGHKLGNGPNVRHKMQQKPAIALLDDPRKKNIKFIKYFFYFKNKITEISMKYIFDVIIFIFYFKIFHYSFQKNNHYFKKLKVKQSYFLLFSKIKYLFFYHH